MPKRVNYLEPANSVIEAFGGCTRLGKILGVSRAAVSLWRSPQRARQHHMPFHMPGQIPEKHIPALREAGKQYNVQLEAFPYEVTAQKIGVRIKA